MEGLRNFLDINLDINGLRVILGISIYGLYIMLLFIQRDFRRDIMRLGGISGNCMD